MREARQTRDGRWYVVDPGKPVCRIGPPDWSQDAAGHWPRVDLTVRALGEEVSCPSCATQWVFEEMDCVFGVARREGNDAVVLVRCTRCRLPHRVRAVGVITAYPRIRRLMAGWLGWERRRETFEREERRLYGE